MAVLFLRAFLQVALVALNVAQIAKGNYGLAFLTGWAISALWWSNARGAGRSEVRGAALAYSAGAAFGTVAGMGLSRFL
jgi:hypothetical protein